MAFFRATWRILTLTCDESTRAMSDSLDGELPYAERLAYRLHSLSCRHCRRFMRQIHFLRTAGGLFAQQKPAERDALRASQATLEPEARQRIEAALREADNGPVD